VHRARLDFLPHLIQRLFFFALGLRGSSGRGIGFHLVFASRLLDVLI
jgi:hypothetical protein